MSDALNYLRVLHNNPFIFAPALGAFFEELGHKNKALLLGYLVLPLTLYLPSRKYLQKANRNSSMRTMVQDRTRIYGLSERVNRYRGAANTAIQYLIDVGCIQIEDQLSVVVVSNRIVEGASPTGVVTAARRLGSLFRPYEVATIYRMLGVMLL